MTDSDLTAASSPLGSLNGLLARKASKDKKKTRKQKKEAKKQRVLLERFPPEPPRFGPAEAAELERAAKAQEASSGQSIQDWLRPAARSLANTQLVAAQKSSALIAINCLMLSIAALTILRDFGAGQLGWALVPLALTNVLSLAFAIRSAQAQPNTTLEELWAMSEDEYEPALSSILQDEDHLYGSLRRDLHLLGNDLDRRQRHLRTAYNVLLGGVSLSTLMFAFCFSLSVRA